MRGHLHTGRDFRRDLSGRVRRRQHAGQSHHVHGRHLDRNSFDRLAALFVYAFCIATLGLPQSGFAVSLALVLLMIAVIVHTTEEMLQIFPVELREASYALGVPNWRTITKKPRRC